VEKLNRFGPAPRPSQDLRLAVVKVAFSPAELAKLDISKGHYTRAAFMRAAALSQKLYAALPAEIATTWAESARVQSCFTQINDIAYSLNQVRQNDCEAAAATKMLAESGSILAVFKEFRATVLGGQGHRED
jgi:hypothetical protein